MQAGDQLDVEGVLEGTFQKLEGVTRVSVQLTDVSRGAIVWSDTLDLPEGRLFEVQDEIARRVVEGLRVKMEPDRREGARGRAAGARRRDGSSTWPRGRGCPRRSE